MNCINSMCGIVKISVEGFFIEKFINICTYRNIKLNNVKRLNGCVLEAQVSVNDFRKLKGVCKKTKCRLKILDKKGIPFFLHRYRKRKIIILPIVLILILIIYSNFLIWKIDINCEEQEITNEVSQQLKQLGIKQYSYKNKIDADYVKNELMLKIEDITWIELEVKGVVLKVDVKTGNLPPNVIDENEFCNIISTKTGVIDKVIVKNGIKVVDSGDIVEPGDVLITGVITSEVVEDWLVHAQGEVYAKVWYSKTIKVPLKENKYIYTGNKEVFYGTNLINKKVFFGKVSTNYEEYDTMLQENNLRVFNINLPIKIYEYTYYEKQTQNIDRTVQEALDYAISIVEPMLLEQIPNDAKVLDKRHNTVLIDNDLEVELVYECLEQIGTEEKISLIEGVE